MDVRLTFINNSNDEDESDIVIFQKNGAHAAVEAVAWQVIRNCVPGGRHPFVVPRKYQLDCADIYGNFTPRLDVERTSMQFEIVQTEQGDIFRAAKTVKTDPLGNVMPGVLVFNKLDKGRVVVNAYKGGKLAAAMPTEPGGMAGFEFAPAIYIGQCQGISEGSVLRAEQAWIIDNKLSLHHVAEADVVMTGGGESGAPIQFELQNVVRG